MLNALLYLRLTSFKNWGVARVRRLRQPKYLLGAIVGVAYFYYFFFRPLGGTSHRLPDAATAEALRAMEEAQATLPVDWLPMTTALGALALLTFIAFMWVVPTQRAALGFTEAEIAFLFPAPISRRNLVHFRLLSSQFRSLVGAIVMTLFSNRWTIIGGNAATHAIGWWFIFSALNLHFSGASFTLTRLNDTGVPAWRRRVLFLVLLAAVFVTAYLRMPSISNVALFRADTDLRAAADWFIALTTTAPLGWVLWPFKWVLGPFLAVDVADFVLALGPALAVLTLHYLWVVRAAVAFEDVSVEHAQKRGARIAAWRSGQRPAIAVTTKARSGHFRLAPRGRPEIAFLWKNLLSTWQYFRVRTLLVCAAVIVGACVWMSAQPLGRGLLPVIGIMALSFGGYVLVIGPQFARQDIRSDLAHADVLKIYPLAGWQIVLGELLTPIVILTGVLWLTLLTLVLTLHPGTLGLGWLTPSIKVVGALCLALLMPLVAALQLLVPNAAALFFPAWFQVSRGRGGGPEVFGQRMIFFFAQIVTMVFALLPPALIASLLVFVLEWWLGPMPALALATLAVFVVLAGEVWCGVWLLGQRFERLDLSADLRA